MTPPPFVAALALCTRRSPRNEMMWVNLHFGGGGGGREGLEGEREGGADCTTARDHESRDLLANGGLRGDVRRCLCAACVLHSLLETSTRVVGGLGWAARASPGEDLAGEGPPERVPDRGPAPPRPSSAARGATPTHPQSHTHPARVHTQFASRLPYQISCCLLPTPPSPLHHPWQPLGSAWPSGVVRSRSPQKRGVEVLNMCSV
jgi:hypothetical protein